MFVKPKKQSPLMRFLFGTSQEESTRRPIAGRERMKRYLDRWHDDSGADDQSSDDDLWVADDKVFIARDGQIARSLFDLRSIISEINDSHFYHHTSEHGNDFARWLREVWKEETAAALLEKCGSRDEAIVVIDRLCKRRQ